MAENTMPAAEANDVVETNSYELAFHVLPTVAEGEVASVVDAIKAHITTHGGELGIEEAPERIELAYEIEKYLEGKYRKFGSAYFGWVRFTAEPAEVAAMMEEVEAETNVLRHLLLRLTKMEEAHPFYYHEALADDKQVANVDVEAALTADEEPAVSTEAPAEEAADEDETTPAATEADDTEKS
jgi:ribosomal protein S6